MDTFEAFLLTLELFELDTGLFKDAAQRIADMLRELIDCSQPPPPPPRYKFSQEGFPMPPPSSTYQEGFSVPDSPPEADVFFEAKNDINRRGRKPRASLQIKVEALLV